MNLSFCIIIMMGVSPLSSVKPLTDCGRSFVEPSRWRVVGGRTARPGTFPWLVPLFRSGRHVCGASVLSRRWLVTAAHCVHQKPPTLFTVQPGDHQLLTTTDTAGHQLTHQVDLITTHPDYTGIENSYQHDIALLRLSEDLEFNTHVQPICLPGADGDVESNRMDCFVAGWGKTLGTVSTSDRYKLQYIHDRVRSWEECRSVWSYHLSENHLCYGNGDPTPCNGDSGGGLVCKDGSRWILAGVASWVWKGCDRSGFPGVFISVSKYLDWIEDQIGERLR